LLPSEEDALPAPESLPEHGLHPPLHLVDLLHDHFILVVWVPAEFHGCAEEDG
jgi:hypothetical protein